LAKGGQGVTRGLGREVNPKCVETGPRGACPGLKKKKQNGGTVRKEKKGGKETWETKLDGSRRNREGCRWPIEKKRTKDSVES